MPAGLLHLHTYFLLPFSIDKQAILEDHRDIWTKYTRWIDGLDEWVAVHHDTSAVATRLGAWKRSAYTRFDLDSPAYQDMVFFHPIVRRVFFDTCDAFGGEKESLLRCYTIPIPAGESVWLEAEDKKGRCAKVQITDLRLFLFANGIGILSIGVEAFHLPAADALWINESLRKVYPSSGRQLRESRIPSRLTLAVERNGSREVVAEEHFEKCDMIGFLPPLSNTITSLIYFADYEQEEFEPVLDERMIVYTYFAVDPATIGDDFIRSEEYQYLLSRFLYVDRDGAGYRYNPDFIREEMKRQTYSRWAHQGTYYGFTSYSNITATIGAFDCDEHQLREGFLIHRMFQTRYYLMALVALFYRATLLDFAERAALVSKQLYLDQADGRLGVENIRMASDLRADFLHFSNYWHFDELANKDEELEHFTMQCGEYRIRPMKAEIEEEIEKLNASLHTYHQFRNTEAINRLAVLSLLLGAGAVLTGFFGMNFGHRFGRLFFEPDQSTLPFHYAALAAVLLLVLGAVAFAVYVVAVNWQDYREIVVTRENRKPMPGDSASLRRSITPPGSQRH
ncbi:MAG: CorA family divalent cation transporter [Bryobacteraceae bacterium]